MEDQLIGQNKLAKYFSLQLDECTDVANQAILMLYVRFEHEGDLKEEFFFSASLPTKTTGSEVFKTVSDYIVNEKKRIVDSRRPIPTLKQTPHQYQ